MCIKLAVYGTLRCGNAPTGRIRGTALVYPGHRRFPAMVYHSGVSFTIVELKDVNSEQLSQYDEYEAVSADIYRRIQLPVEMDDGFHVRAWVYMAGEKLLANAGNFEEIPGGDWFKKQPAHGGTQPPAP